MKKALYKIGNAIEHTYNFITHPKTPFVIGCVALTLSIGHLWREGERRNQQQTHSATYLLRLSLEGVVGASEFLAKHQRIDEPSELEQEVEQELEPKVEWDTPEITTYPTRNYED